MGKSGKQYDFNFDFDYGDKIVCSDVIQLFQQLNFLLKKALVVLQQHLTLSQSRYSGGQFEIVALYIMGEKFQGNLKKDMMT